MSKRADALARIDQMRHRMRKLALDMALAAGGSSTHFGGGVSIIDITATLYGGVMTYDAGTPEWPDRDRFILIIEKLVIVIVRTSHFFQFIQKSHSGPPFYVPAAAVPPH